jgi:hypothetical protein
LPYRLTAAFAKSGFIFPSNVCAAFFPRGKLLCGQHLPETALLPDCFFVKQTQKIILEKMEYKHC